MFEDAAHDNHHSCVVCGTLTNFDMCMFIASLWILFCCVGYFDMEGQMEIFIDDVMTHDCVCRLLNFDLKRIAGALWCFAIIIIVKFCAEN